MMAQANGRLLQANSIIPMGGMPSVYCVLMIQLVLMSVQMFGVLLNEVGLERHLALEGFI